MKITYETLKSEGWVEEEEFGDIESCFTKEVTRDSRRNSLGELLPFHLTLRPYSNTDGRCWTVHVDNNDFDTVASLDVSDFEQIEKLVDLCV